MRAWRGARTVHSVCKREGGSGEGDVKEGTRRWRRADTSRRRLTIDWTWCFTTYKVEVGFGTTWADLATSSCASGKCIQRIDKSRWYFRPIPFGIFVRKVAVKVCNSRATKVLYGQAQMPLFAFSFVPQWVSLNSLSNRVNKCVRFLFWAIFLSSFCEWLNLWTSGGAINQIIS